MNFRVPTQFKALGHISYGKRIHASRDWLILLLIALILLIGSALWSTWLFLKGVEPATGVAPAATQAVSTHTLEEAGALFEMRANEEAKYRNEYRFVDPER